MTKQEFLQFIEDFKYLNRKFSVKWMTFHIARIEAKAILKDVDTGEDKEFGDYREVEYQNVDEFHMLIIMRNWMTILALHELDEHIQYKGKKVFDPHKTKNYLW